MVRSSGGPNSVLKTQKPLVQMRVPVPISKLPRQTIVADEFYHAVAARVACVAAGTELDGRWKVGSSHLAGQRLGICCLKVKRYEKME